MAANNIREPDDQTEDPSNDSRVQKSEVGNVGDHVVVVARPWIIIEPVLAMFSACFASCDVLISQFLYKLVADRHNLTMMIDLYRNPNSTSSCAASVDGDQHDYVYDLEQLVQNRSATLLAYMNACTCVPAIFVVVLYGAYSDKFSRKLPLVIPLLGQLMKCSLYIVTLRFSLPVYVLLIANIIEGLSGGQPTMTMACYSYLINICRLNRRTARLAMIDALCCSCNAAGQILIGLAISHLGFMWPFVFVIGLHAINVIYVIVFVPELKKDDLEQRSVYYGAQVVRGLKLYTVSDEYGQIWQRWLLLGAILICDTVVIGRWSPLILFTLNSPLCWNSLLLGVFFAWCALWTVVGQIGLVKLLHSKLHDVGLAILGCLSGFVYFLLLGFCKTTWFMFFDVPIGLASFLPIVMLRSMSSKLAPEDCQGAVFATLSVTSTVCDLVGSVMFNLIYGATLYFMTSFVFFVMAAIELLGLIPVLIYFLKSESSLPAITRIKETTSNYESLDRQLIH